jgi:hypothetical protein
MDKNAGYWIRMLGLSAHPEGGHYREKYRSSETVSAAALPERFPGDRCFATSIYYLLESGEVSTFHRIRSDEIWYHHDGAPVIIHVLAPGGGYRALKLGRNVEAGEAPQALVGAGCWFGATVEGDDTFCLAGCSVSPGFDFADFELAERDALLEEFPHYRDIITKLTR